MRRRPLNWAAALVLLVGLTGLGGTAAAATAATTVPSLTIPARTVTLTARTVTLQARVVSLKARVRSIAPKRAKSGTVTVDSDVLFAFDSATLSPDAEAVLTSVVANLKKHTSGTVTVNGYTDSIGTPAFNLGLSQRRATAVRALLSRELPHGLHLMIRGYGETHPVATNKTGAGRQQNRRVTLGYAP